jgi:predicted ribonuclease YlaK
LDEKQEIYELPYKEICNTLFGRPDAWDRLKEQGYVRFISTTAIRGISIDDAIILVDENQNLNWSEVNTIITRVGHRSKIIFSGDFKQTDLIKSNKDQTSFHDFLEVARKMPSFQEIYFTPDDIVRSSLVKQWIVACEELGY